MSSAALLHHFILHRVPPVFLLLFLPGFAPLLPSHFIPSFLFRATSFFIPPPLPLDRPGLFSAIFSLRLGFRYIFIRPLQSRLYYSVVSAKKTWEPRATRNGGSRLDRGERPIKQSLILDRGSGSRNEYSIKHRVN